MLAGGARWTRSVIACLWPPCTRHVYSIYMGHDVDGWCRGIVVSVAEACEARPARALRVVAVVGVGRATVVALAGVALVFAFMAQLGCLRQSGGSDSNCQLEGCCSAQCAAAAVFGPWPASVVLFREVRGSCWGC